MGLKVLQSYNIKISVSFAKTSVMGLFDDHFEDGLRHGLIEGQDYYLENGYRVMTEKYLTDRGYCCANGCRHCPYWPKAQKGNTNLRHK